LPAALPKSPLRQTKATVAAGALANLLGLQGWIHPVLSHLELLDSPKLVFASSVLLPQMRLNSAGRETNLDINIIKDEGVIGVGVGTYPVCELALNLRTSKVQNMKLQR
jgi:hypothetical protein